MPCAVSAWLFPVRSDQVVPHFPVVAMYSLDFLYSVQDYHCVMRMATSVFM